MVLSDEERLKIPLVGNANIADPSQIPVVNENSLNILIKQEGSHIKNNNNNLGVSIYPMSEQDKVKDNLTALTGIDFDDLLPGYFLQALMMTGSGQYRDLGSSGRGLDARCCPQAFVFAPC